MRHLNWTIKIGSDYKVFCCRQTPRFYLSKNLLHHHLDTERRQPFCTFISQKCPKWSCIIHHTETHNSAHLRNNCTGQVLQARVWRRSEVPAAARPHHLLALPHRGVLLPARYQLSTCLNITSLESLSVRKLLDLSWPDLLVPTCLAFLCLPSLSLIVFACHTGLTGLFWV